MASTRSRVFSRVLPPAPYVTEQKPGLSLLMISISLKRFSSPFSVFGGKNSTDRVKPGRAYRSANFTHFLDDYLRRSGINNTMLCDEQLAQNEKAKILSVVIAAYLALAQRSDGNPNPFQE